jgi:hypothetical protein
MIELPEFRDYFQMLAGATLGNDAHAYDNRLPACTNQDRMQHVRQSDNQADDTKQKFLNYMQLMHYAKRQNCCV